MAKNALKNNMGNLVVEMHNEDAKTAKANEDILVEEAINKVTKDANDEV